jgi:tetratricopeptide (TPR) repeat protein
MASSGIMKLLILRNFIGPARPIFIVKCLFKHYGTHTAFNLANFYSNGVDSWPIAAWYRHCCRHRRMSDFEKKMPSAQVPAHEQDTESLLLERLKDSRSESDYFRWLLFVVGFYRGIHKVEAARALLRQFIERSKADEQLAHCHLTLGQIATDEQQFEAALNHFKTALAFNPKQKQIAYVLYNNTAYCLNALRLYSEGEHYCQLAIEINWTRASAYRNLGVSLEGQGKITEAAWALVEAAKADVADERARILLRKLIEDNPDVLLRCPWTIEGLAPNATGEAMPRN